MDQNSLAKAISEIQLSLARIETMLTVRQPKQVQYGKNPDISEVTRALLEVLDAYPSGLSFDRVYLEMQSRGVPIISTRPRRLLQTWLFRIVDMHNSPITLDGLNTYRRADVRPT